jgi:hypothetical protein
MNWVGYTTVKLAKVDPLGRISSVSPYKLRYMGMRHAF